MQRSELKFEFGSPGHYPLHHIRTHFLVLTVILTVHTSLISCCKSNAKNIFSILPNPSLHRFHMCIFLFLSRVINSPSHFVRIFDTLVIVPIIMATILASIFYQDSSSQTKFHSLSILINWILALYFLFDRSSFCFLWFHLASSFAITDVQILLLFATCFICFAIVSFVWISET